MPDPLKDMVKSNFQRGNVRRWKTILNVQSWLFQLTHNIYGRTNFMEIATDFISFPFSWCIFLSIFSIEARWTFVFEMCMQIAAKSPKHKKDWKLHHNISRMETFQIKQWYFRNKYVDQIGYDSILRWSAHILRIVHICLCISLPMLLVVARIVLVQIWSRCASAKPLYMHTLCMHSTC